MTQRADKEKQAILTAVSGLAATRLGAGNAVLIQRFVAQFYDHVAADDLVGRSAEDLYGAALSLWQFAQERQPGKAKLRAFNPRAATDGWNARHTIVEIVNDDMPFLVDSVSMALQAEGVTVHLVIHPVLGVARDRDGRLVGLVESGDGEGECESAMHVEISEVIDPARLAAITARVDAALMDTRSAVADWRQMRDVLAETSTALERAKPPLPECVITTRCTWSDCPDNRTTLPPRPWKIRSASSGTGGVDAGWVASGDRLTRTRGEVTVD